MGRVFWKSHGTRRACSVFHTKHRTLLKSLSCLLNLEAADPGPWSIMDLEDNLKASEYTLPVSPSNIGVQVKKEHQDGDTQAQDYADGALRAWSTVAGSFILSLYTVGLVSE
jgi:hypothetical protein